MKNQWYVVYTKRYCENKISNFFTRRSIENYVPLNKITKPGFFLNTETIEVPLFKTYVFVSLINQHLSVINENKDIINFVFWLGRPVLINEFEIQNIKTFVKKFQNIKLEKTEVKLNKINREISRIYNNYGEENNYINKISIKIDSLGYNLIAENKIMDNI